MLLAQSIISIDYHNHVMGQYQNHSSICIKITLISQHYHCHGQLLISQTFLSSIPSNKPTRASPNHMVVHRVSWSR